MRSPYNSRRAVLFRGVVQALLFASPAAAQTGSDDARLPRYIPSLDDLQRAERRDGGPQPVVLNLRLAPRWSDDGNFLWYRRELPEGRREFMLVDAISGRRERAFDHQRLAAALRAAGVVDVDAERLELVGLWIDAPRRHLEFNAGGKTWRCRLDAYELTSIDSSDRGDPDTGLRAWAPEDGPRASVQTGDPTAVTFVNRTEGEVELFWLDPSGNRVSYGSVPAGAQRHMNTYAGHVWLVVGADQRPLAVYVAEESAGVADVTGQPPVRRQGEGRGPRGGRRRGRFNQTRSPDGQWEVVLRDHNVFLRSTATGNERQLSADGRAGLAYDEFAWSPDSRTILAWRVEPGDEFEVHLIESSPRGGGRARLSNRRYPLPGDRFPVRELHVFDAATGRQMKPAVDRIDFEGSPPHWLRGGEAFAYEQVDRGHQRYRLIEVDLAATRAEPPGEPAVRTLIDERSETFIWTAHFDGDMPRPVTWLERTDELIYSSERDGWRHLYLFDAKAGVLKNPITRGAWVVRAIDRVDEERRQIWFRASGLDPDQDPYFIHYCRINFDGTGLVRLTAGNGTHRITYSPDGRFLIDSYSRVDLPPVHELRRVEDGALVCELERSDASALEHTDWEAPEPFVAKGRDGVTDIWGIICRPVNFDPAKRYPVIEYIYAGPQGAFVPKSFTPRRPFAALNALGFIVVQIDGMGTAHRSKAFHDVCWHNLKDAGFPDRILWHRAAAAKYPQYDLERVGIYGGSAGGQNAAAAVLFHGDFYRAAVAGCGCHDNRMDKASWNEQWMGYPVGPQYAECSNIENAARLAGRLMLIVGELDTNVPPESTYRFADALIKAEKDFDLVLVPGAGHGMGGVYGERRMRDFFVRHLHEVEPLERNRR